MEPSRFHEDVATIYILFLQDPIQSSQDARQVCLRLEVTSQSFTEARVSILQLPLRSFRATLPLRFAGLGLRFHLTTRSLNGPLDEERDVINFWPDLVWNISIILTKLRRITIYNTVYITPGCSSIYRFYLLTAACSIQRSHHF